MIPSSRPRTVLDEARRQIEIACRELTEPDVGAVREAVEDVHRLTGALGELVDRLMERAPAAFGDGSQQIGQELVRDLHAMRGCLTTARLLVAPAVDDLRALDGTAEPAAG